MREKQLIEETSIQVKPILFERERQELPAKIGNIENM
jgi:hypothetical protein